MEGGRAVGVVTAGPSGRRWLTADLIVVAAGGFGTPAILERSVIRCEPTLSVDPVLTIAARDPVGVAVQRDRDAIRRTT